jgi:hypothetical protein
MELRKPDAGYDTRAGRIKFYKTSYTIYSAEAGLSANKSSKSALRTAANRIGGRLTLKK